MKHLLYWLPAVAAVGVAALMIHGPVVDAYHDWTRDWHLWQLQAWGGATLFFLVLLGGAAWVALSWLAKARAAIARRQAQPEEEQV